MDTPPTIQLNTAQENRLRTVFWTLDRNCAEIERLLTSDAGSGLVQIHNDLSPEERAALQRKIDAIRSKVAALADDLNLAPHTFDVRRQIRATFSLDWSALLDTMPAKLRRYGDVEAATEQALQPLLADLLAAVEDVLGLTGSGAADS